MMVGYECVKNVDRYSLLLCESIYIYILSKITCIYESKRVFVCFRFGCWRLLDALCYVWKGSYSIYYTLQDVILLFVQPIRYSICYEWNILFYLFVLIIFSFRFYCFYNRFINYYFVTFTLFRLLLSHHCCVLIPYYCVLLLCTYSLLLCSPYFIFIIVLMKERCVLKCVLEFQRLQNIYSIP